LRTFAGSMRFRCEGRCRWFGATEWRHCNSQGWTWDAGEKLELEVRVRADRSEFPSTAFGLGGTGYAESHRSTEKPGKAEISTRRCKNVKNAGTEDARDRASKEFGTLIFTNRTLIRTTERRRFEVLAVG
jgi:hypothetical protein